MQTGFHAGIKSTIRTDVQTGIDMPAKLLAGQDFISVGERESVSGRQSSAGGNYHPDEGVLPTFRVYWYPVR